MDQMPHFPPSAIFREPFVTIDVCVIVIYIYIPVMFVDDKYELKCRSDFSDGIIFRIYSNL